MTRTSKHVVGAGLAPLLTTAIAVVALAALAPGCGGAGHEAGFGSDGTDRGRGGNSSGGDTFGGSGAGVLGSGCATATSGTSRAPVYMLVVLDGSGSMGDDNKWSAVVPALDAIFDDLLAKNDGTFAVGLNVFADDHDPTCGPGNPDDGTPCIGPYPSSADVGIGLVDQAHHDALRARVDTANDYGNTPTYASLSGGYRELEGFAPAAGLAPGGKKVLVIMTDGVPDDGASEQSQCTSIAASELAKGITTFAVGIGPFPSSDLDSYDPAFMGRLAHAGGASPAGCNPSETQNVASTCYFQVTPGNKSPQELTQSFVDAIDKIRGEVGACEFVLDKSGGGRVDPSQVNVVFTDANGVQHVLVQDAQNGWTYDDPTDPSRVVLHGSACDEVKSTSGKISIVLGCSTVTR